MDFGAVKIVSLYERGNLLLSQGLWWRKKREVSKFLGIFFGDDAVEYEVWWTQRRLQTIHRVLLFLFPSADNHWCQRDSYIVAELCKTIPFGPLRSTSFSTQAMGSLLEVGGRHRNMSL